MSILSFLRRGPMLDEPSTLWLFELYGWALRNLDAATFRDGTRLVLPNNEFFPGEENSVDGMARLIFGHVTRLAGVAHWPWTLLPEGQCPTAPLPRLELNGPLRSMQPISPPPAITGPWLAVGYDPALIRNPEPLIAGLVHQVAHFVGQMVQEPPPGGVQNWPQITEVIGVFLGFGLMFANSAYQAPARGCGSCGGGAGRGSFLSQYDLTYALAIFCALKGIPNGDVLPHLKGSLRGYYKGCAKEIQRDRGDQLQQLADASSR